jgi:tetratricopeptide (TPR) repeat protein
MTPATLPDGPARDALCQAAAILDVAELTGQPFALTEAHAQMGRCYRGLGSLDAAAASFAQALRWSHVTGSADMATDLLCDLAEVAADQADVAEEHDEPGAHRAARERARDHAFAAAQCAASATDADWEAHALMRVCSVLERCGDRSDALSLQKRARRIIARDDAVALPDLSKMQVRGAA